MENYRMTNGLLVGVISEGGLQWLVALCLKKSFFASHQQCTVLFYYMFLPSYGLLCSVPLSFIFQ
jgi:hypothetical protein